MIESALEVKASAMRNVMNVLELSLLIAYKDVRFWLWTAQACYKKKETQVITEASKMVHLENSHDLALFFFTNLHLNLCNQSKSVYPLGRWKNLLKQYKLAWRPGLIEEDNAVV